MEGTSDASTLGDAMPPGDLLSDAAAPSDAGMDSSVTQGDATTDDSSAVRTLTSIEIAPTQAFVELALDSPGSTSLTALGRYSDGSSMDVTELVDWTAANPKVGEIRAGVLSVPAFHGLGAEVSTITAKLDGLEAAAQVTVAAHDDAFDAFLVLPYQEASAREVSLSFPVSLSAIDLFFLVDATTSMGAVVQQLKNGLQTEVLPGIRGVVADSQFGIGGIGDFPVGGYGEASCYKGTVDQPFVLKQAITPSLPSLPVALNTLLMTGSDTIFCGGDVREAGLEGVYQVATGAGLSAPSPTAVSANHVGKGGVGFRQAATPLIVTITDADSHNSVGTGDCGGSSAYEGSVAAVAHTRDQTAAAVNNLCGHALGVAVRRTDVTEACQPLTYLQDLAVRTGARVPPGAFTDSDGSRPAGCSVDACCTGLNFVGVEPDADGLCPLVARTDSAGAGIRAAIVEAVAAFARSATFDISLRRDGELADVGGHALSAPQGTAAFIKSMLPREATTPSGAPSPTKHSVDPTFSNVTVGSTLTYSISLLNDFVAQTDQPQLFRVSLSAHQCYDLSRRELLILVPPAPL